MSTKRLTIHQRKTIFRSLVETQDAGTMSVTEAKRHILRLHGIDATQLEAIIDEGIEKEWPPLDQAYVKAG